MFPPQRIVCLTEETVETLYLLSAQDRIVGLTDYAVRPPEVRREKVRVGTFTSADIINKVVALAPIGLGNWSRNLGISICMDIVRAARRPLTAGSSP